MTALTHDIAAARLREMTRIRRFEETCAQLYSAGKIRGFLHLCVGEEAVPAGIMPTLDADDAVVSTYRDHGHALARGIPMGSVMAEMFGKVEGCCHGRGGSMHIFDASRRFYGGNAIVAGGLPLAVGLALGDAMLARRRVTACFFGDGAAAEGEFHECLNLASLWKLPVLFLCENNQYAMGTALPRHQADPNLARKADGYLIPNERVDGMDVVAVEAAARRGVAHVREGHGPYFIELITYRFRAHSMFDPELYRDRAEVERWRLKDPLKLFVLAAVSDGAISDDDIAAIERDVAREVAEAVAFAEAGTFEPVETLLQNVTTPREVTQ